MIRFSDSSLMTSSRRLSAIPFRVPFQFTEALLTDGLQKLAGLAERPAASAERASAYRRRILPAIVMPALIFALTACGSLALIDQQAVGQPAADQFSGASAATGLSDAPPGESDLFQRSGSLRPKGPFQGLEGADGLNKAAAPELPNSLTEGVESLDQRLNSFLAVEAAAPRGDGALGAIIGLFTIEGPAPEGRWGVVAVDTAGKVAFKSEGASKAGVTLAALPIAPDVVAMAPSFKALAAARGAEVRVVDPLTGAELDRFSRGRARVTALDWSPDGQALLIGAVDGRVYRWRLNGEAEDEGADDSNRRFERYIGHAATVSAVRYHPLGRIFFTGDWDGEVSAWLDYTADPFGGAYDVDILGGRFFSSKTQRVVGARAGKREAVDALAVSADGAVLAAALQNGAVEVWKSRGFAIAAAAPPRGGMVRSLAVSPDGSKIAAVSRDSTVRVYAFDGAERGAGTRELRAVAEVPTDGVQRLAFLKSGALLGGDKGGKVFVVR